MVIGKQTYVMFTELDTKANEEKRQILTAQKCEGAQLQLQAHLLSRVFIPPPKKMSPHLHASH